MGQKQKRCSKQQREIRRAANAEIFNDGFTMGYNAGYQQGQDDLNKTPILISGNFTREQAAAFRKEWDELGK